MNLFVLWTESYGEALKAANHLASNGGHILDCSVIGKWSQVLVHFEKLEDEKHLSELQLNPGHKKAWIPGLKTKVIESYLSLSSNTVSDFLLTVETMFVGDVFDLLQSLNLELYPIVDFRLLRFNEPKTLLLLTGLEKNSDQLLKILENIKAEGKSGFHFEMTKSVVLAIKELFHHVDNP